RGHTAGREAARPERAQPRPERREERAGPPFAPAAIPPAAARDLQSGMVVLAALTALAAAVPSAADPLAAPSAAPPSAAASGDAPSAAAPIAATPLAAPSAVPVTGGLSIDVTSVLLYPVVRHGKDYVRDLSPEDLIVLEEGRPVAIDSLEHEVASL